MYLWVVLATFLAMIASYSLAPRADIREITVEPLAQADLGRFVMQHRAAFKYAEMHTSPYNGILPDPDQPISTLTTVTYSDGIILPSSLEEHLPFGQILDASYTSQIFCLDEGMENELNGSDPCNKEEARRLLITYGPIPERWINLTVEPDQPSADFMNAIRNTAAAGEVIGYTVQDLSATYDESYNVSGSKVRIMDGRQIFNAFVPTGVLTNPDYLSVCDVGKDWICLAIVTHL